MRVSVRACMSVCVHTCAGLCVYVCVNRCMGVNWPMMQILRMHVLSNEWKHVITKMSEASTRAYRYRHTCI